MPRRNLRTHDHSGTGNGGDEINPKSVSVANQLGVPVYSSDGDAPTETTYFNDSDGKLKYKDASGTVFAPDSLSDGDDFDGQSSSKFTNLASLETEEFIIGGKLYILDGTFSTNTDSFTYTMDTGSRDVIILTKPAVDGYTNLRINGDTGNNYDGDDWSGSETNGATEWNIPGNHARRYLHLRSQGRARIGMGVGLNDSGQDGNIVIGRNDNQGGDITQFTLFDGGGSTKSVEGLVLRRAI
jgi:hypothetical protein